MIRTISALVTAFVTVHGAEFSRDIAPILVSECLTCHNAEKAKGGYRVHQYGAVITAGKSKEPAVVPGKPEASELFKRLVTHDEDDRMPQEDEPLSTNQVILFREWIAAGATLDRGETNSPLALLIPRAAHPTPPEHYKRPLPILAMAFTPDGTRLATSGYHEILFWNLTGKLQLRVTNAPARVHSIAIHPTAPNLFAVAGGKPGRRGEISIYQNDSFLTNIVQHTDELLSVVFSPDGELLAAGGSDNTIRIYNTTSWSRVCTIQQHADWVTALQFSDSGAHLLSASRDRTARTYNSTTGELEITYPNHASAVTAAVFVGEDRVASAGREKTIHLWDITEGKKRNEISGAEGEVTELIATDKFLFVACADKTIRQYYLSDRKLARTYSGHTAAVYSLAYHHASELLASGSFDGMVKIWNAKDGTLVSSFTAAPLFTDVGH